jgi:hypothetical protein
MPQTLLENMKTAKTLIANLCSKDCWRHAIVSLCLIMCAHPVSVHSATKFEPGSFLIYDVEGADGMFWVLFGVFGTIWLYDQNDYSGIKIDLHTPFYLDLHCGPNWWDYFFEPISFGDASKPVHITLADHIDLASICVHLPRQKVFELIQKYVRIKPHIQEEVSAFTNKQFSNHFVIGVHHRGTDKKIDIPIVPYEKTKQALDSVIMGLTKQQRQNLKIYVASDEQQFLMYMLNMYGPLVIYSDFVRSNNGIPLHYGDDSRYSGNYQKGKEALLDCLILSKCNFLIRPCSGLSIFSSYFNPDIPVVAVNP